MFPLVGWTITMQMKLMVQFVPPAALHPLYSPSAHRLLFPFFFSFGFFRPYSSSYIVCANVVNVPLSRRFGEQLTLLCCTLYFFTRHLDSLFDVFFCCQALECATLPSTIEFDSLLTVGGRIVWLLRAEVFDRWEFTFSPNLLLLAQLLVYESWSVLEVEWFRPLETTTKKPIVFILLIFYGGYSVRKGSVLKPSSKECLINLHSSYADFFPYFYEFSLLNSKTKKQGRNEKQNFAFRSVDTETEE